MPEKKIKLSGEHPESDVTHIVKGIVRRNLQQMCIRDRAMIKLGLNIDHVATLRQVRGARYPNVVRAALLAESAGVDSITLHLREDRRHIQDRDVEVLRDMLQTRMNLESAVTDEMINIALRIKPHDLCLVPERREELTTEGGLDVVRYFDTIKAACVRCAEAGIRVSLFIDPESKQIDAARRTGAPVVEMCIRDRLRCRRSVWWLGCRCRLVPRWRRKWRCNRPLCVRSACKSRLTPMII